MLVWIWGAAACVGPLGVRAGSVSVGSSGEGGLRRPELLPVEGDGYVVPGPWRQRHAQYGTDGLVGAVVRAARAAERDAPGGLVAIGDLSHQSGGGSVQHHSHQSGRDVDVFFAALDAGGRPVRPSDAMLHFAPDGHATRWSPPQGVRQPQRPVPAYRFDARRNWAVVRALLGDPSVEVQWIFIQRGLAAALLREAASAGDDPALLARAAFILHEPTDSEPHDDHMHVRLYCDPGDRALGCSDHGPARWWKKLWKYMAPPYGRPAEARIGEADLLALGRMFQDELPSGPTGAPTS